MISYLSSHPTYNANMNEPAPNNKKRSKARKFAMQALYTWHISDNSINSIQEYYLTDRNPAKFDSKFFSELLHNISAKLAELDLEISTLTKSAMSQMNAIELSILRVGAFELIYCPQTPVKVIINEALELAKTFGALESYRFINAILDKIASKYRNQATNLLAESSLAE